MLISAKIAISSLASRGSYFQFKGGKPRMTIGKPRMTIGKPRMTIGKPRVTIGKPRIIPFSFQGVLCVHLCMCAFVEEYFFLFLDIQLNHRGLNRFDLG